MRAASSRVTLFPKSMSPDKLFDYLDGKLTPEQRDKIEQQLATDTHLQRELAVAREIHGRMQDSHSREVLLTDDVADNRGAIVGRRVAVAFAVLVFLNVVFGLYAIGFMAKKERARPRQEQNRQDLVQALDKAAADALPTPTLDVGEIKLSAPPKQRDALANKVMALAQHSGGSAVKNLSDESGLLLFAEIPGERVSHFRDSLAKLGATLPPAADETAPSGKAILQIRIIESMQ